MSAARVPFALVGVLLLVGSATFAGSLGGPTVSEPDVDRAMDRTESATQSAVRGAVTSAAVDAAREPVTLRSSSSTGQVLSRDETFRDALRVRIYVATRDRLRRVSHQRGDVTVNASLPATPTAADLEDSMERVSIARVGNDRTALRATVENVTLTARRNGEVVGQRDVSPTVRVPVPTLAVHDRVDRFEDRLNAGPTEDGLGGHLTAQLYALTWTRGYAQFEGAAISNVLANRHLSLLTNSNVLSMQRKHFGTSDPRGQSVLRWAAAHTAITDTIEGTEGRVADRLSQLNSHETLQQLPATILKNTGATSPATAHDDTVTVGINSTADRAFFETLSNLEDTIEQTYTAEVELRQRVIDRTETVLREPREPGSDWELATELRDEERSVESRSAPEPEPSDPWHVFEHYPRTVTLKTTIERVWNTSDGPVRTVEVREERAQVNVTLVGRHDGGPAPGRPVRTIHERGGPLNGPNLASVEDQAKRWLLNVQRIDDLAVEAVRENGKTRAAPVTGEQPDGIYEYVYNDIARLREDVRDLSFTTTRGNLSTYQVNPGARLREKLDQQWDSLVDTPSSYAAAPSRARYNARVAYLRTVANALEERAEKHEEGREEIESELADHDMRSLDEMQRDYENQGSDAPTSAPTLPMRVEAAPSYLTLGELDGAEVGNLPPGERTHPLVARNVNAFTVPYGDVAEGIVETFVGPDRVRLQTAVQTLRAAKRHNGGSNDESVDVERLESNVRDALGYLSTRASIQLLSTHGVPSGGKGPVVQSALAEWDSTVELGEAWLDGSAVEAIQTEAESRFDLSDAQSDELWLRLKAGTARALDSKQAQPPKPAVNETVRAFKNAGREMVRQNGEELLRRGNEVAIEEVTNETLGRLPAGLPLAPPFAPWYTTINYWQVQVRGEYTRFTVSVPRGTPDTPGARFRYVRDDGTATLDVDGDGSPETLGRTERVRFRTHTSVAIAVPPGPRGVGDVDGDADERSSGWPHPG